MISMPITAKTQEIQDSNQLVKLKAVQSLQQLLRLIDASDFSGTVTVAVQAQDGLAGKIRTSVDQYRQPDSKKRLTSRA